MLAGVDVSNDQGDIAWDAVAASGKAFAFARASEGVGSTDPFFFLNWPSIRAVGMTRGAYHHARPSRNQPEVEAAFFMATIDNAGGLLPGDLLILDIEDPEVPVGTDLLDWVLRWVLVTEQISGIKPVLLSERSYLESHQLVGQPELTDYPLWLAAHKADPPQVPAPWSTLAFWQYSATESVPGVQGHCNSDQFFGDIAALHMLGVPGDVGPSQMQQAEASLAGTPAPAQATPAVREQLDKLTHVAVLLDSISARDLAGVVRTAVTTIKQEYNIL